MENFSNVSIKPGSSPGDANVIFISSDSKGSPGALNQEIQSRIGVKFPLDPNFLAKNGYYLHKLGRGPWVVWIVTIQSGGDPATLLRVNLEAALRDIVTKVSRPKIWIPLMGTGSGGVDYQLSAQKIVQAIEVVFSSYQGAQPEIVIAPPKSARIKLINSIQELIDKHLASISRKPQQVNENKTSRSFGIRFERESAEGLALGYDKFAIAIARLLLIAKGEFSLALLGRWGSGKTTIAKNVVNLLRDKRRYKEKYSNVFDSDLEEGSNISYDFVVFNAWRYRRQPELWIWLYESFIAAFLDCGGYARILRPVRAGIAKHGLWSTLFLLVALAFTAGPLMWVSFFLPYGVALFGVVGFILLLFMAKRWFRSLRTLVDRYGIVSSHREQLGMQALIGEDLKSLVKAWTKSGQFEGWRKVVFTIVLLLVWTFWVALIWQGSEISLIDKIKSFADLYWPEHFGKPQASSILQISTITLTIWTIVSVVFSLAVITDISRVDRILLIVDDLDRCPQEEIVDLIDGVKLMIDDEEVGRVVQALVLADDRVLEGAIKHRFEKVSENAEVDVTWNLLVKEHMEKVFLCHIYLPKMEVNDVGLLLDSISEEFVATINNGKDPEINGGEPEGDSENKSNSDPGNSKKLDANEEGGSGNIDEERLEDNDMAGAASDVNLDISSIISNYELLEIKKAIQDQFDGIALQDLFTPRVVRSYLFKYQLARMLLQSNEETRAFEAKELAGLLAAELAISRNMVHADNSEPDGEINKSVASIVKLIA